MYSIEIRNLTIVLYNKIKSLRKVESLTNISRSSICRWNIDILPIIKKSKYHNLPLIIDSIKLILNLNPFFTISEIQSHLQKTCNLTCSYSLIRTVMRKNINLTYKKVKYANFLNENSLKQKTIDFHNTFKNKIKSVNFIASIDEVGFSSNNNPLRSWSCKGKPNYIQNKIDIKNRKNKSTCACISSDGNITYNTISNPYNKISFLNFFKTLKLPKNTLILIDNINFHHSKDVITYSKEKEWELLFIPPYSPWFNPIEHIFGIIKHQYRKNKNIDKSFNFVTKNNIINSINFVTKNILNNVFNK